MTTKADAITRIPPMTCRIVMDSCRNNAPKKVDVTGRKSEYSAEVVGPSFFIP